jgi:deoxyribonuclease V
VTWWPIDADELVLQQRRLAAQADTAREEDPMVLEERPLLGGCFVAFARGEAGPGHPGDHAWAAAVTWRPIEGARDEGAALRGASHELGPRVANDTHEQAVVAETVPAAYEPGLLALREGPILERVVRALRTAPDALLVDATGLDHPRRAGLAIHLGQALGVPTVGVTHRPLRGGEAPESLGTARGERSPLVVDGEVVAYWVVTSDGTRPVVAHAGWRTTAAQAAEVVLLASTSSARTPVPLGEARRVAREARAIAGGAWGRPSVAR